MLGSKTKGQVYLRDKQKDKQRYEDFNYGNYHSYYSVRRKQGTALVDPRVDLLDKSYFNGKRVLDIGCNSGNITISIAKKYDPTFIHGIDIDESLIKKANTNLRVAYSLGDPKDKETSNSRIDLSFRFHHFPQSMTNMFGFLPMTVPPNFERSHFPYNVQFDTMDWTEKKHCDNEAKYDTIMALSVTKWIQLHGGDKGLKSFFKKVYDSLNAGGTFVLEPQEFQTLHRRAKQIDPSISIEEDFKFRPEDYTDFLINKLGFREYKDLGVPRGEIKGFSRPIILYIK